MNGIGSSITRIPIALYTGTHMCALMLTPAQIDVQMADATFCKTSVVIKNYQSSEIFSRGLSESRRRALLVIFVVYEDDRTKKKVFRSSCHLRDVIRD